MEAEDRIETVEESHPEDRTETLLLLGKPEKIIFLCDVNSEVNSPWDESISRLQAIKQALSSFVKRKLNSSLHHKFAVASFSSSHEFEFLCNFTRSQDVVQGAIDKMSYSDASSVNSPSPTARTGEAVAEIKNDDEDNEEDCVDLSLLLNNIAKKLQLPSTSEEQEQFSQIPLMSHHYITRIILLYNRSNEIPALSIPVPALQCTTVYLDILYLHEKVSNGDNECQYVFDMLAHLQSESNNNNYIFETHPSTIKLYSFISALMTHGVQRDVQQDFLSKLDISALLNEI